MGYTELENFYREDGYCGFGDGADPAYFREYCNYVRRFCQGRVYELGSGRGFAAASLQRSGVDIVATDIFPAGARETFRDLQLDIEVRELNINRMDLPDASVPNFCLYQVLEHIETPRAALAEIYRCLQPGGHVVIVGPNLLSPLTSLKVFLMGLTRRWDTPFFRRTDGYSFPFGDTVMGSIPVFWRNLWLTLKQLALPSARHFRWRKPCLRKPAVSDSDAALLLNPLDLTREMRQAGFAIVDCQSPRRSGCFAGSTWVVGKKP